ncbi:hypothetical protein ZIOFF_006665 [Zingiber officinale]|uniref:Uncharacterized protein n=1 Tax=Zingiber officinale TaxID=94328 RepID=A0A8J5LVV6_ZINOF|nr:hypothetical protein ZIOFF_006665 [Zingiber officinale]
MMRWSSPYLGSRIRSWLRDYDCLQFVAVVLIYIQNGVGTDDVRRSNVHVAILDRLRSGGIAWRIVQWRFADQSGGTSIPIRSLGQLGISTMDNTTYCADYNVRDSFVNPPTNEVARQTSNSDEILGGSVYDPTYYSSLFEDIQETQHMTEGRKQILYNGNSSLVVESPKLKSFVSKLFQVSSLTSLAIVFIVQLSICHLLKLFVALDPSAFLLQPNISSCSFKCPRVPATYVPQFANSSFME